MALFIECTLGIILFTLIIVPLTLKNPLAMIGDYPPAIKKRCEELGLIEPTQKRFTAKEIARKIVAVVVLIFVLSLVIWLFNDANTFWKGFLDSFIIWCAIDWFDALVIDCLWFCHSKKVRIKGTEEMKEYGDCWFHIKNSLFGMILGIPVCSLVGLVTVLFSL